MQILEPEISRLRICHLGKFYHPASGGIETHLRTLAHAQSRLGARVQVVCVNHQDKTGKDVTWQSMVPTQRIDEWDGPIRLTRLGRSASFARLEICRELPSLLSRLARSSDLLHVHVPNPTMILALALARPQLPTLITYHSDVVKQKFLARLVRPFENLVFSRAGAVVATSPTYRDGSEFLQKQRDKLIVLPFGIDLRPYRFPSQEAIAAANRFRAEHGQPLWLAVGRLVYYKGLENALRALPHVPGCLLIVGEGPLRQELGALAARLGVADRVIWRGRLTDTELVGAYHAATALWFPSNARSEAFGFVQVEAMASGCPVINTRIPGSGVSWVSRHEETGLTVAVNDPEGLAQAARRLLFEDGLRARLSRRARERTETEFGDDLMARRTLSVYGEILGHSGTIARADETTVPSLARDFAPAL